MSSVSLTATDAAHARQHPLDAQALQALAELDPDGSSGLVQRVLKTFSTSLARLMGQFEAARAAGDTQALRHVAHTLKSSSASVGALALSALCADVERRVRDAQLAGLEPVLDLLRSEAVRVGDAVGLMLRESP